jgi:hypothetical protein
MLASLVMLGVLTECLNRIGDAVKADVAVDCRHLVVGVRRYLFVVVWTMASGGSGAGWKVDEVMAGELVQSHPCTLPLCRLNDLRSMWMAGYGARVNGSGRFMSTTSSMAELFVSLVDLQ